jgi:hypothetical protein
MIADFPNPQKSKIPNPQSSINSTPPMKLACLFALILGLVLGMCWFGSCMMPREGPDIFDDPPNQKSAIINHQS